MSNDSGLFHATAQLRGAGFAREGTDWVASNSAAPREVALEHLGSRDDFCLGLDGCGTVRYVPLYEAKLIHQFDHRWATYDEDAAGDDDARSLSDIEKKNGQFEISPRYWVQDTEVTNRLSLKNWTRGWLFGHRGITNATNERTFVAAVFPTAAVGNSLPVWLFDKEISGSLAGALIANATSLVLDFVVRQKVGGTNLNFFYIEQFPVLAPSSYTASDLAFIVPRVLELTYTSRSMAPFARDLGYEGPPFAWDEDRRAQLRAELDAWYAHAYGLTRDELRYILDPTDVKGMDYPSETFRVLKTNEIRRYGEFRTARLVLQLWDAVERDTSGNPSLEMSFARG